MMVIASAQTDGRCDQHLTLCSYRLEVAGGIWRLPTRQVQWVISRLMEKSQPIKGASRLMTEPGARSSPSAGCRRWMNFIDRDEHHHSDLLQLTLLSSHPSIASSF